ncbi:hypothetical protein Cni_G00707 [Canna indica]|uniref:Uncharacterized protein n=1 Tax=Canna indica TaxID=4628 RepID=A0AAQ3JL85_9LILI|nr:hypothetical protein Cni_G00707 [Canna indica]
MPGSHDAHVVLIPPTSTGHAAADDDHPALAALQHHPLTQISESAGHLLLLKLWQREEDLHGRRAAAIESRMDAAKRAAFHLSCLFLSFHGLSLTLIFNASVAGGGACRSWWLPSSLSLLTSLVVAGAVQAAVRAYWALSRRLQRERGDGRALARCVQELRMKGDSFDLSKEPQTSKRMKSSSVEVKWRPLRWCSQNLVTICLLFVSGSVFSVSRFILCS